MTTHQRQRARARVSASATTRSVGASRPRVRAATRLKHVEKWAESDTGSATDDRALPTPAMIEYGASDATLPVFADDGTAVRPRQRRFVYDGRRSWKIRASLCQPPPAPYTLAGSATDRGLSIPEVWKPMIGTVHVTGPRTSCGAPSADLIGRSPRVHSDILSLLDLDETTLEKPHRGVRYRESRSQRALAPTVIDRGVARLHAYHPCSFFATPPPRSAMGDMESRAVCDWPALRGRRYLSATTPTRTDTAARNLTRPPAAGCRMALGAEGRFTDGDRWSNVARGSARVARSAACACSTSPARSHCRIGPSNDCTKRFLVSRPPTAHAHGDANQRVIGDVVVRLVYRSSERRPRRLLRARCRTQPIRP